MKTELTTKQWVAIGRLMLIERQLETVAADLPENGWWKARLSIAKLAVNSVRTDIDAR